MQNLEQKVSSIDKINEKLTNLILELQTEVKNLKEDTICNAQHLQMLKEKNNDINHKIISAQNNQLKSTMSFVNDLQKENEANGTNNYADFIKGLIINDFKAMQNEIVESIKREQGGSDKKVKAQTPMSSAIALILSVICFVFLLIISIKFKLISQMIG
jgi:hypothetical protein